MKTTKSLTVDLTEAGYYNADFGIIVPDGNAILINSVTCSMQFVNAGTVGATDDIIVAVYSRDGIYNPIVSGEFESTARALAFGSMAGGMDGTGKVELAPTVDLFLRDKPYCLHAIAVWSLAGGVATAGSTGIRFDLDYSFVKLDLAVTTALSTQL